MMVVKNGPVESISYSNTFGDFLLDLSKKFISNPEARHNLLPNLAKAYTWMGASHKTSEDLGVTLHFRDKSMPLIMQSPIILAAGGNKEGQNLTYFPALGLGGISVGTATRSPCPGNPFRPRLQMLPKDKAIQNSMGLNNPGIEEISRLVDMNLGRCHKKRMCLGISVADTPGLKTSEAKIEDILFSFRKAYRAADYVEVNVSCPNTGRERIDWQKDFLQNLLREIVTIRKNLAPRKAVFVKLSPDMSREFLETTLDIIAANDITGLVLFNTFPAERTRYLNMKTPEEAIQPVTASGKKGGISGSILYQNTLPAVQFIKKQLPNLHIMAVGGVDDGHKALQLLEAGADAVQCYTVLAYRWNAIHKINREMLAEIQSKGRKDLSHLYT